MKILIGNAWPYANGSLHIGHIAALLPGDILARYHRAKGDEVYFVSGSDCHGTPVAIRARQEGKTPQEISDHYHEEFQACFSWLGFSYDVYTKTSAEHHKAYVQGFHKALYQSPFIDERTSPQAVCHTCGMALADRFVIGKCPFCGEAARGDQCDACGAVLEPQDLSEPQCALCGTPPIFQQTKHLYIALSRLKPQLENLLSCQKQWRKNAVSFTQQYLSGLRDRAVTRDLSWGIPVPRLGYEGKSIYIWAENVLGYLSASQQAAQQRGADFSALWGPDAKHYYVHGKDNIPFHTVILPALLIAHGGGWHLPDAVISSEYMTLEGRRISTSKNHAIWIRDLIGKYHPDSIRYFFIANGPEKRDTDFSWHEYINSHNGELLGAYGNFINRTLAFISKYCGGAIPSGALPGELQHKITALYPAVGSCIEQGRFKDGLEEIFSFVRYGNKYFDTCRPWETRRTDPDACSEALFSCVQIAANLAVLLTPYLPFSSQTVQKWLGIAPGWKPQFVPAGKQLEPPEILFERLEPTIRDF